jgi:hypothetical protein
MELLEFFSVISVGVVIGFFVLFLVIRAAVEQAINSSTEVRILKSELREVNSRLKSIQDDATKGNKIDSKM